MEADPLAKLGFSERDIESIEFDSEELSFVLNMKNGAVVRYVDVK